jgi:hypothetical protein
MTKPMDQEELNRTCETIKSRAYEFAEKVQPIFEANNWQWTSNHGMHVPSVNDIFLQVLRLASAFAPGQSFYSVSSGRISVWTMKHQSETENFDEYSVHIELVPWQIIDHFCMERDGQ